VLFWTFFLTYFTHTHLFLVRRRVLDNCGSVEGVERKGFIQGKKKGTDFDFGEGFFFLLSVCSDIHGVCGYGLWWDVTMYEYWDRVT
jgi:hypothetical protein